jgi:hypothetical protein
MGEIELWVIEILRWRTRKQVAAIVKTANTRRNKGKQEKEEKINEEEEEKAIKSEIGDVSSSLILITASFLKFCHNSAKILQKYLK